MQVSKQQLMFLYRIVEKTREIPPEKEHFEKFNLNPNITDLHKALLRIYKSAQLGQCFLLLFRASRINYFFLLRERKDNHPPVINSYLLRDSAQTYTYYLRRG